MNSHTTRMPSAAGSWIGARMRAIFAGDCSGTMPRYNRCQVSILAVASIVTSQAQPISPAWLQPWRLPHAWASPRSSAPTTNEIKADRSTLRGPKGRKGQFIRAVYGQSAKSASSVLTASCNSRSGTARNIRQDIRVPTATAIGNTEPAEMDHGAQLRNAQQPCLPLLDPTIATWPTACPSIGLRAARRAAPNDIAPTTRHRPSPRRR